MDAADRFEEERFELILEFFLLVVNLKVVYDHPFEYSVVVYPNLSTFLLAGRLCL